jgi:RHS repeat-associated protein
MFLVHDIVLCRYHYDPLDRLVGSSPAGLDSVQRFYQKSRLATEIQGQVQRSFLLTEEHLLAQHQQQNGQSACTLLGTDQQRSVLQGVAGTQRLGFAYAPYGFRSSQEDLPGFNGEQPDPVTGHYLLGNGYRAFNPVLMRFNSPDSLSPFGEGGLNGYGYCVGDPVNRVDSTGHLGVRQLVAIFKRTPLSKASVKAAKIDKHPIALAPLISTPSGMIKGDINARVSQRVGQVKAKFRAYSEEQFRNLKSYKRKAYLNAMREANTLSPEEQAVKTMQMRPLPPTPDGRVFGQLTSFATIGMDLNIYDLPRGHLPRTDISGISGLLPKTRPMETIPEGRESIRTS